LVYFVAKFGTIDNETADTGWNVMASRSKAALELKRLREHAGYSVRGLAAALLETGSPYGRSPSTFAYYESEFRRPYLPGDLVENLAPLLEGRGDPPIAERQVLALGGPQFGSLWVASGVIGEKNGKPKTDDIDDTLLARILERVAGLAADREITLSERQRARLAARLYRQTIGHPRASQTDVLEREIEDIFEIGRLFLEPPA
jgi:uncharacterized protein YbjT (DUF2867 family)